MKNPSTAFITAGAVWLLAGAAQASPVVITDPVASEWAEVVLRDDGAASVSASVVDNPDSEWRVAFSIPVTTSPGATDNFVAYIYEAYNWNPATDGGIDRIDVAIDLLGLTTSFSNNLTGGVRPVLRQAGKVYGVLDSTVAVLTTMVTPTTWTLRASDTWTTLFSEVGLDLSASGSPIELGFRWQLGTTCSGASGCTGASTVTSLDNFRYTIHARAPAAVPEPATWALSLVGLLAALRQTRRRQSLLR